MPNVAGVQFPYTPEGEQAAQLYQRSLSPRRGLGFRPIRMQEGSTPEHEKAMHYIKWAHGEGSDSLPEQFQINDNSVAELLVIMRDDPEAAVKYANNLQRAIEKRSSVIGPQRALREYGAEVSGAAPMEEALVGGLGRREALRAVGDTRLSDQDISLGPVFHGDFTDEEKGYWNRARGARQARDQAGTGLPPYLGVPPSSEPTALRTFNQRLEVPQWMREMRRLERSPEPWEFGGVGVDSPTPQGMAYGGVPRGLRNQRNYGGGIGSLYNRYR